MKPVILRAFIFSSYLLPLITAAPSLVLDNVFSPPASPPANDADRIYSVSLGHIISKAVVAYLHDDSGNVITDTTGLTFNVTSLDALDTDPDTFAQGGASLCQYGNRREYPNNFEGRNYGFYCSHDTSPSMVVSGIPVHEGVLRADGLYHLADSLPPNNRKFMITMEYQGNVLTVTTNGVEVTTPAAQLVITTQPSTTSANTDFTIVAEIQDKDGNKITSGIDATLPVMLQVATNDDMQILYGKDPLNDMVFRTLERLAGTDAKLSVSSKSMYIDKRAVAGEVTFTGVRLLDVHNCAKLNLTMRMPNYPHSRMPNTYYDLTNNKNFYNYFANDPSKTPLIVYGLNGTSDGAVTLSNCIDVTEQTATALQLVTPMSNIKMKIGANFVIEDKIVLRAIDSAGAQVHSGSDSKLTVSTTGTGNGSVCLSTDMLAFNLTDGVATVEGSICQPNPAVTLTFEATSAISVSPLTTVVIGPVEVTNEIHLASYYQNYDSGSSSQTGTFSASFAQYCVEDINAGRYPDLLPGRSVSIDAYNTKNSAQVTTESLMGMIEHGRRNPHEKVAGIVGFGSNTVTKGVAPLLAVSQIPNIATNEDESAFSDKTTYPYYSRLSWNMASTCHSIMMAFKNRGWTTMSIVRTVDFSLANIFYEKAKEFGIKIAVEVAIPRLFGATYTPGAFSTYLKKVKDAGTRIGWMFVFPPVSYYFLREAIDAGMGGIDGWQWNMLGLFGWAFPWANQGPTCMGNVTCAQGWVGANCWILGYDMTMHTDVWKRLVEHHRHSFRKDYLGTVPKLPFTEILAEYSLAYDAVIVYAKAMTQLINETKTITGPRLTETLRQIEMQESLSGHLKFNENGDRPGYIGVVVNVNPHPFSWPGHINAFPPTIAMFSRMIFMESDTATTQWEYNMQAKRPMDLMYGMEIANYTIAFTQFTNKRLFNGSENGRIGTWSLKLELRPSMSGPLTRGEVMEDSPAPFYCTGGCGGNQTNIFDITEYQFGRCGSFNICSCNPGYYGDSCEFLTCNCVNGICEIPNVCVCSNGWTGTRCEKAICSFDCGNGFCSGPDECKCNSGYVGTQCTQSIYVVTIIPVICFILLIIGLFFLSKWLLRRHHLKQALQNLDWLVKWDEVIIGDTRALSIMSTAGDDFATSAKSNMCTWRSQKCYIQRFDCDSLSVESEALRLEVVAMREVRHNNLIQFIGACLDYPNVCMLSEVTPKGSLEDLLSNEAVKLGWDFKFSLLKDICRGMHFLHLSEIHSHGRLKSANCLVDNRWTCKISGFGLPTLRYNGPRKAISTDEEVKKVSSLFWTAPELLAGCHTIDDVKQGTKHGDVYSFGIILAEVCTREEPYTHESGFLEPEQIVQLVLNKDASAAAEAKQMWYKSGGDTSKLFRPKIGDSSLPEEYAAKQGLLKLMSQCWGSSPELRPSFKNVNEKLNEIYPVKGELIDNLVNMLEKYSSNLEQIVAERTKELVEEKRKTEHLISQMLPKKVVEDLKHGNPVEPESFECVTIFFSDIVGFTNIARNSTPFQVVDLLNDLYTTFDAILDNYDCYKVETIGDAYMIVSGLPVRNGDLHAGEISTCSLDLMAAMVGFKIRHMPEQILQLRVGMHSGPCVAGVVGLKMPRYCLFGDTVNTASRMESSSMALRIHMSDSTAQILKRLGGYHLDCRGEREVKGKGVMTTWWLDGKDGFDKKLPGKDMAASLSQHEFK